MRSTLPLLAGALVLVLGCNEPKGPTPENDHTVQKLAEELKKHPPADTVPRAPSEGDLAKMATNGARDSVALPLHGEPQGSLGPLLLTVQSASLRHTVSNGKLSVASQTPFVELHVGVSNASDAEAKTDLGLAKLVRDGDEETLAIDAQRLAGTRDLHLDLAAHGSTTAVLLFEAPAPGKGTLDLVLPGSPEVRIPVQ